MLEQATGICAASCPWEYVGGIFDTFHHLAELILLFSVIASNTVAVHAASERFSNYGQYNEQQNLCVNPLLNPECGTYDDFVLLSRVFFTSAFA